MRAIEYQGTWVKVTMARDGGSKRLVANVSEADFFVDPVGVGDAVIATWSADDIHLLNG